VKPIYFPFTFISAPEVAAVSACFKQTAVYQPSRRAIPSEIEKLAESGLIDVRIPVAGDEDRLGAILKDYNEWARIHKGGAFDFLRAWDGKVPFFDETSLSQIRSDIRKDSRAEPFHEEFEDGFSARLFLAIAQEFDLQQNALNRDLDLFDAMERNLIKELQGEEESSAADTPGNGKYQIMDPGLYMTSERLKAWAVLNRHDQEASGLFVTTSRSVVDELIDRAPEIELVMDVDGLPIGALGDADIEKWQEDFLETLRVLVTSAWPMATDGMFKAPGQSGADEYVSIKLYIAPGEIPHELFGRCAASGLAGTQKEKTAETIKNTLIGLIDFKWAKGING
jgi:hypothetical protein